MKYVINFWGGRLLLTRTVTHWEGPSFRTFFACSWLKSLGGTGRTPTIRKNNCATFSLMTVDSWGLCVGRYFRIELSQPQQAPNKRCVVFPTSKNNISIKKNLQLKYQLFLHQLVQKREYFSSTFSYHKPSTIRSFLKKIQ